MCEQRLEEDEGLIRWASRGTIVQAEKELCKDPKIFLSPRLFREKQEGWWLRVTE